MLLTLLLSFGCFNTGPPDPLHIVAASEPSAWLAERLGGDLVRVERVLPAGADAPTWTPTADALTRIASADLFLTHGAGYEPWAVHLALPEANRAVGTAGLNLIEVAGHSHSHGGHTHSHGTVDPHTWADPAMFSAEARVVHAALAQRLPRHIEALDAQLQHITGELQELGRALDDALGPYAGRRMAMNHPSFRYLARRGRFQLLPIDLDPESPPEDATLATVEAWLNSTDAPILWWEEAPSDEVKHALPEAIVHLVLDPLERPNNGQYDPFSAIQSNISALRAAAPGPTAP